MKQAIYYGKDFQNKLSQELLLSTAQQDYGFGK